MDIKETIKDSLKDQSILEYPVFHFVLPEYVQKYREEPYLQGTCHLFYYSEILPIVFYQESKSFEKCF